MASELVAAGLVDGRDLVVIAANLNKITQHPELGHNLTFRLVSRMVFCLESSFFRFVCRYEI